MPLDLITRHATRATNASTTLTGTTMMIISSNVDSQLLEPGLKLITSFQITLEDVSLRAIVRKEVTISSRIPSDGGNAMIGTNLMYSHSWELDGLTVMLLQSFHENFTK